MIMTPNCETERLEGIIQREGLRAAQAFALQSLQVYRKAVLCSHKRGYDKPHHASFREYRQTFIESYLAFKLFVAMR